MQTPSTAQTTARTPGPWAVKEYNNGLTGEYGLHGIFKEQDSGAQHTPIVEKVWGATLAQSDANAAFIVQACNAHDDLVAALRGMVGNYTELYGDEGDDAPESVKAARAALAKAGAL